MERYTKPSGELHLLCRSLRLSLTDLEAHEGAAYRHPHFSREPRSGHLGLRCGPIYVRRL